MKHTKSLLLLSSISLAAMSAFALPVRLETTQFRQPDGSVINIKMMGNGDFHFATTEDGTILTFDNDGYYRPATINDAMMMVPVGMKSQGIKYDDPKVQTKLGMRKAAQSGMGLYPSNYPTTGSPRVPIVLVEYSDVKFSNSYDVKEYFTNMANADKFTDYGNTGSIKQYFKDQSSGKFTPRFDVYGPVTLPESMAYYGGNYGQGWDVYAHKMVSDACKILDPDVDFSKYDNDGDGEIDFVYIIYAGYGEHRGFGENCVSPHAGKLQKQANFAQVDGKWLNSYACSNELISADNPEGACAFIHEYSHILGLPDLYTTDDFANPRDFTPGQYTILDYGVYNNDGKTPPNYTAYERNALQWNEPKVIDSPVSVKLDEISTGEFYLIPTSKTSEFFLLENRQLTGWDAYLPNHGLLIWHIDYEKSKFDNNEVNFSPNHQYVDLVEANNIQAFAKNSAGYTFPGTTGNTSFTAETTPAFVEWSGVAVNFPITNIREKEGYVYFDVAGGDGTYPVEVFFDENNFSSNVPDSYLIGELGDLELSYPFNIEYAGANNNVEALVNGKAAMGRVSGSKLMIPVNLSADRDNVKVAVEFEDSQFKNANGELNPYSLYEFTLHGANASATFAPTSNTTFEDGMTPEVTVTWSSTPKFNNEKGDLASSGITLKNSAGQSTSLVMNSNVTTSGNGYKFDLSKLVDGNYTISIPKGAVAVGQTLNTAASATYYIVTRGNTGGDNEGGDVSTGVGMIGADENGNFTVFTINGAKVVEGKAEVLNNLEKGLYIINGKKVIIR